MGKYKYYSSVTAYVKSVTGRKEKDLIRQSDYEIKGLDEVSGTLLQASKDKTEVALVGDYDADGLDALCILVMLCRVFGIKHRITIPKRMTEGYGVSDVILQRIDSPIILTVDNGISADFRIAKEKGCKVIVLDHHIAEKLPDADIIINPHAIDGQADFIDYCGAGLAYKLAEYMVRRYKPEAKNELTQMSVFAMIGTVADCVTLLDDNRRIVQEGLTNIRLAEARTEGLSAILVNLGILPEDVTEESIGYKIAPIINSCGRMIDDGGKLTLATLLETDPQKAVQRSREIISVNEIRKGKVKEVLDNLQLDDEGTGNVVTCDAAEGIIGIIAGQVAESTDKPVIVLCPVGNGIYKGSGRSNSANNLVEVLNKCSDYLIQYGGHAGAAGLKIEEGKIEAFTKCFKQNCVKSEGNEKPVICIEEKDADEVSKQLAGIAPFGMGLPEPFIKMEAQLRQDYKTGLHFKKIGKEDSDHVRLYVNPKLCVLGFHKYAEYMEMGEPTKVTVVGKLRIHNYKGTTSLQIIADNISVED